MNQPYFCSKSMSGMFAGLLLISATMMGHALAAPLALSDKPQPGDFSLVGADGAADIFIDKGDAEVVRTAADCLANDIELVTGKKAKVTSPSGMTPKHAVLIGTIGHSAPIDALIRSGKLNVKAVQGKWEAYTIAVVPEPFPGMESALVVAGSDRRGTAFGVFTISDTIGVSPWYWWSDVTPAHRDELALSGEPVVQGPPSVKYRGIFLNDEDWSLTPWAKKTFEPEVGNVGPKTYAKICELLLRLKANYLWPAMHHCTEAFNHYPENKLVADKYGIVMGSSHCEQMLRNNVGEYDEKKMGPWNYDQNRRNIIDYWRERLQENGKFENIYTIGMRGIHDSGMPGGGTVSQQVRRLQRVVDDQRDLIAKNVNPDPSKVPQIFCPYKEVLELYLNGLKVPDDVTIVWPDDNYGYVRQLPNEEERKRSGGSGIYYHISYLGAPNSYLWLCTTPPALIWEEMNKAYTYGARDVWVINVGGMKKADVLMDFFLHYAWNVGNVPAGKPVNGIPVIFDQKKALEEFAARTFGSDVAPEIASILDQFYRLNFSSRSEFFPKNSIKFTFDAYDEAQTRLARFAQLAVKADQLESRIDPRLKNAYYEMVAFPVKADAMRNEIMLYSRRYDELKGGDAAKAQDYAAQARSSFDLLTEEVRHYNEDLVGGKWNKFIPFNPMNRDIWRDARVPDGDSSDKLRKASESITLKQDELKPRVHAAVDGVVSIPAELPSQVVNKGKYQWEIIDGLGRTASNSSISVFPPTQPNVDEKHILDAPSLSYEFEGNSTSPEVGVVVYALPSFPIVPGAPLRYAIAIDDGEPAVVSITEKTEGEPGWKDSSWGANVMRSAAIHTSKLPMSNAAKHTVRVWSLDPGIVLEKIVVDLGGLKKSIHGPPAT